MYRHDCDPVVQMLNTAGRVVAWGVMPLLGGGFLLAKGSLKVGVKVLVLGGVRQCFVCCLVFFCLIQ
jgi:hypothetical protein